MKLWETRSESRELLGAVMDYATCSPGEKKRKRKILIYRLIVAATFLVLAIAVVLIYHFQAEQTKKIDLVKINAYLEEQYGVPTSVESIGKREMVFGWGNAETVNYYRVVYRMEDTTLVFNVWKRKHTLNDDAFQKARLGDQMIFDNCFSQAVKRALAEADLKFDVTDDEVVDEVPFAIISEESTVDEIMGKLETFAQKMESMPGDLEGTIELYDGNWRYGKIADVAFADGELTDREAVARILEEELEG